MSKYQVGDVVLASFPFEDSTDTKARPVVIIEILEDQSFVCMVTGTDKSSIHRGFMVKQDSPEGKEMRLKKDSFIDADRTATIKNYMIFGRLGYCPYIKELEKMLL
jgi:hypothetical protein